MELKRKLIKTEDGSHTLYVPELNEHYHSIHGAIQESNHVFINAGLNYFTEPLELSILEVGFGTGLNALLTLIEAQKRRVHISFASVEKYPVFDAEIEKLNYANELGADLNKWFKLLHKVDWNRLEQITDYFSLKKVQCDLVDFDFNGTYDLIYFDAFAPDLQPKLWTKEIFENIYNNTKKGGVLVTYSAKGFVKRNLKAAGFTVTKIPGPPGKREMIRAIKGL